MYANNGKPSSLAHITMTGLEPKMRSLLYTNFTAYIHLTDFSFHVSFNRGSAQANGLASSL